MKMKFFSKKMIFYKKIINSKNLFTVKRYSHFTLKANKKLKIIPIIKLKKMQN